MSFAQQSCSETLRKMSFDLMSEKHTFRKKIAEVAEKYFFPNGVKLQYKDLPLLLRLELTAFYIDYRRETLDTSEALIKTLALLRAIIITNENPISDLDVANVIVCAESVMREFDCDISEYLDEELEKISDGYCGICDSKLEGAIDDDLTMREIMRNFKILNRICDKRDARKCSIGRAEET
jgi:hypothetical protein